MCRLYWLVLASASLVFKGMILTKNLLAWLSEKIFEKFYPLIAYLFETFDSFDTTCTECSSLLLDAVLTY